MNDKPVISEAEVLALVERSIDSGEIKQAIETLKALDNAESQTAAICLTLGDLYLVEKSNILAKECYTKALALASAVGDLQVQVVAKAELARIENVLEKQDEANRLYEEVLVEYEALGDVEQRSKVGERLRGLINGAQKFISIRACAECTTGNGHRGKWVGVGLNQRCVQC